MSSQAQQRLRFLRRLLHKSGPYLLLEILLPGGTLFALLLFVYQRYQHREGGQPATPVSTVMVRAAALHDDVRVSCQRAAAVVHAVPVRASVAG